MGSHHSGGRESEGESPEEDDSVLQERCEDYQPAVRPPAAVDRRTEHPVDFWWERRGNVGPGPLGDRGHVYKMRWGKRPPEGLGIHDDVPL